MPLMDYLMPNEEVRFQSTTYVNYGDKLYQVILTNKRLVLYAKRGLIFKSDDVVSWKLDEIQGLKYKEQGIIGKKGIIEIHGKTKVQFYGPAREMKALYQQLMEFL